MDSLFESRDWLYKRLYDTVMEAIVASEDVKRILSDLQTKELLDKTAAVNLILSLDELADLAYSKSRRGEPAEAKDGKTREIPETIAVG
jgi:hypothetical protein